MPRKDSASAPRIRKGAIPKSVADETTISGIFADLWQKNQGYLKIGVAVIAIVLSVLLYKRTTVAIKDLTNANNDDLRNVFFGDTPYLFYCQRDGPKTDYVPRAFTELNSMLGSKMGFAIVNCSQKLPSGKSISERFKLKKEWRPTVFGTMPWGKPQQAGPTFLKDGTTLKKFVDTVMAPKGTAIKSDKELTKFCGFGKGEPERDVRSIGETCLVVLRGKRYAKTHTELESHLVTEYPKLKIATVDANKLRLSFESEDDLPADLFGLKLHALRNGTHSMSMVNPVTWDYLTTFVSNAIGAPLYEFDGSGDEPIKLLKASASGAAASSSSKAKQNERGSNKKGKNKRRGAMNGSKRPAAAPTTTTAASGEGSSEESRGGGGAGGGGDGDSAETIVETESERLERERRRREQMERQARAHIFEVASEDEEEEDRREGSGSDDDSEEDEGDGNDDDDDDEDAESGDDDDEEEEIIEL